MINLRKYKQSDFNDFKNLVSDPDVMSKVDGVLSNDQIIDLFYQFINNPKCYAWVIQNKSSSQYLGHIALLDVENEIQSKELIFYIVKNAWHKGYGKLSAQKAIELCSKEKLCEKVIATVDTDHTFSRKILESLGMQIEYWGEEMGEKWPVYSTFVRVPPL